MLRLTCPYCAQVVDETELAPGGQAHLKREGPEATDEELMDYLFNRDNPSGVHFERWRHAFGCGKWFIAARCTMTQQVFGTYKAQSRKPPKAVLNLIAKRCSGEVKE